MCVSCFVWMGVREGGWTRPGPPLHWTGQRWHCSCEQLFNVCSAALCVNKDICLQLLMCVVWRILIGFSHSLYHPVITRQLLPLFGFSGVSVSDRYSHMSPVSGVDTTISYDQADHTLLYLNFKPVDYWLILDMSYILKGFFSVSLYPSWTSQLPYLLEASGHTPTLLQRTFCLLQLAPGFNFTNILH